MEEDTLLVCRKRGKTGEDSLNINDLPRLTETVTRIKINMIYYCPMFKLRWHRAVFSHQRVKVFHHKGNNGV